MLIKFSVFATKWFKAYLLTNSSEAGNMTQVLIGPVASIERARTYGSTKNIRRGRITMDYEVPSLDLKKWR